LFICAVLTPSPSGPSNCYVLPMVLRGGKTQRSGKAAYSGTIRHSRPELCPHRALGYHLMHSYTLGGNPFPDFRWVHRLGSSVHTV
jgi:hypothetical protein